MMNFYINQLYKIILVTIKFLKNRGLSYKKIIVNIHTINAKKS